MCGLVISNARMHTEIQHLSVTDPLTGLNNRRYFLDVASREFLRSRRYRRPLSLIMMDIDHFKSVNDTYGHLAGDQVLVEVAQRSSRVLRGSDVRARYGGEELVFLLLETPLEGAMRAAERIRESIANAKIEINDKTIAVTVSLGVASLDARDTDLDALISRSDQALYAAKRAGRNRVCDRDEA
jgi:diguanylate cyclase (GGDEF)-like protein